MSAASPSMPAVRVRPLGRPSHALDAVVAAVALGLTLALMARGHAGGRGIDAPGVVLAMLACLPLLAHRRAPLGVFALCTAASAAIDGLGHAPGPPFGPTVALFYLAADRRTRGRMRQTALAVIGLGAIHVGAAAIGYSGFPTTPILGAIVVWGGAWIIGDQVRQRHQRLVDLEERARRTAQETERERRLAVAQERTRIARDLHDSAAHAINVILVQAGGARLLQHRDPDAVRAALFTIEDVARETITEIDQLVGRLRENGDGTSAGIEPPSGLASAPTLAARHRAAGLEVELHVDGTSRPLAPGLDQAAYRILQESLTNAARHGRGAADVNITYGTHELELTVSNPAAPAGNGQPAADGYGLLGMRERAALLGGSLEAGRHNGRFQVHARLPYAVAPPASR